MLLRISASAGAIVAALAIAAPASADLTAAEVWASWKALAERSGQTISGSETKSGDTLTVRDVTIAMEAPSGSASGAMGDIAFTENRDGSVSIRLAPEYPLVVSTTSEAGERVEMKMTLRQRDLSMTARGNAGAIAYDFAAPEASFALDQMLVDGEPMDMAMEMSARGISGGYTMAEGATGRIDGTLNATTARLDMNATNPEDGSRFKLGGEMTDMVVSSSSTVPAGMQTTDLGAMLAAGFASTGKIAHGGTAYAMDMTQAGESTNVAATLGPGTLDFALADGGMLYDVRSTRGQIGISGSALPLPRIDLALDDSAFSFRMPMVRSAAPSDFGLLTRIAGLTISDGIWAMFDPSGQLPRDPATLVIDLSGKVRLLSDLTNPAVAQSSEAPAELHELNVKGLKLSLAGAELTGNGAFVFDNSDKVTFDGMPRPTGRIGLRLDGGNTLLDRLVAMGLVPADQAMGMRMMLGMFARPTGEGDTLSSQIEVTPDGRVVANGQRLR